MTFKKFANATEAQAARRFFETIAKETYNVEITDRKQATYMACDRANRWPALSRFNSREVYEMFGAA